MKKLISFVIPVYNVEKYINQCIDSILNQEIDNYEIILINDGSTDKSEEICKKYTEEYEQIRLISTENFGQSSARNLGIKLSSSEYIAFIDSDDYYIENTLHLIQRKLVINKPDLLIAKVMMFYENTFIVKPKINYSNFALPKISDGEDSLVFLIRTSQFLQSVYSYVVKRSLITDNNIRFDQRFKAYEDLDFTFKVLLKAESVELLDEFYLMYRKDRPGQITYRGNLQRDLSAFEVVNKWSLLIKELKLKKDTKLYINIYLGNKYLLWIPNQIIYNREDRLIRYKALEKNCKLINNSSSQKMHMKIAKKIYAILGFRSTVSFMSGVQKFYNFSRK